jgi:hypothetical protein
MRLVMITGLLTILAGCGSAGDVTGSTFTFDFAQGAQGWTAGFSDYPVGAEQFFQLDSGLRHLPPSLDQSKTGMILSGINHSDDLFMFLTTHLTGLKPDQKYNFNFLVEFATDAANGCSGVGGLPGESVYVKVGAGAIQPQPLASAGSYAMNIDKGNQSQGGADAIVIGNIANGLTDCNNPIYTMKTLQNTQLSFTKETDSQGNIWAIVGTDSGYEAGTALYYKNIIVKLKPS